MVNTIPAGEAIGSTLFWVNVVWGYSLNWNRKQIGA